MQVGGQQDRGDDDRAERDRGYTHAIRVIGYNDSADKPVGCATSSFEFEADQMEFYCGGYRDGTSGGPWVLALLGRVEQPPQGLVVHAR
ncbi:MAG: hypothetical protein ACRDPY_14845 [Streptosporangiaceae bacterium]